MNTSKTFWHSWIKSYSISDVLAIGASAIVIRLLFFAYSKTPWSESQWMNLLVLVLSGLFEGAIVAFVEWKAISRLTSEIKLRTYSVATILPSIIAWVFIVPPGVLIVFFISYFSKSDYSSLLYAALTGITFGGLISAVQWVVLRKHFENAIVWVLVNSIAWGISFSIVYLSISILTDSLWNIVIVITACCISGLIQGVATGTALHYVMGVHEPNDQNYSKPKPVF